MDNNNFTTLLENLSKIFNMVSSATSNSFANKKNEIKDNSATENNRRLNEPDLSQTADTDTAENDGKVYDENTKAQTENVNGTTKSTTEFSKQCIIDVLRRHEIISKKIDGK